MDRESIPCAVSLCPALALPGSSFCVGHQHAKRLHAVEAGRTCSACDRLLHEGDWVTLDSVPGKTRHAACPTPKPRTVARPVGETLLFD